VRLDCLWRLRRCYSSLRLLLAAASGSEREFHQRRSDPGSRCKTAFRVVPCSALSRPGRGRRDDRYGRYASTTSDTRMASVLAANGGNTMVRKVIIALAAVT